MYIRGFDLASDTQTGCYLRGFDLQHHKIRRRTPNVIHFHKKATRYWESDWAVSTKNVAFCRKRGSKNGAAPHKRG